MLCQFLPYSKVTVIHAHQFSSAPLLGRVRLFATPWTAARWASLSITNSWSLLKLMPIEPVMPSSHLVLCHIESLFRGFSCLGCCRVWSRVPCALHLMFSRLVVSDSLRPRGL